jgi:hypothetical protein
MKLTADRPFADPEKAARRLMQHAHAFEVVQDGRIYIEKINGPFLYVDRGTPAEYSAGLSSRSNAAGSNCMTAGLSFASRSPGRTSSPEAGRDEARPLRLNRELLEQT